MAAQEAVAKKAGYDSWKHVVTCAQATAANSQRRALPRVILAWLEKERQIRPVNGSTRQALASGIVFSMDVKDADGLVLGPGVSECQDAMPVVAGDILAEEAMFDDLKGGDDSALVERSVETLFDYRLFRYDGHRSGPTLEHAFADVLGRYFFAPHHVWLDGRLIDIDDVDVRVAGKIIYSAARDSSG